MPKITREKFKTFDDVFDQFTLRTIFKLSSDHELNEDTISPVKIGKESNVFSILNDSKKFIFKIYRLQTADFNRMYSYIRTDPRFAGLKKQRRKIIFAWCQREYRNLLKAREAQLSAPLPIDFLNNILLMEFVEGLQLKDLQPEKPKEFFNNVIKNMKRFYKHDFVHGDLSKFNILNSNEKPVLIDFSQATPINNPIAKELFERDVKNVCNYFKKQGLKINEERVMKEIKG